MIDLRPGHRLSRPHASPLTSSRLILASLLLALAPLGMTGIASAQVAKLTPTPTQEIDLTPNTPLMSIVDLARQGQFETILAKIKADPASASNGSLQNLVHDLEIYSQHQKKHAQERAKNYTAAREAMTREFKAGRLEIALVKAIDAHSHAAQGREMLVDDEVVDLVNQSRQSALDAENRGDWLSALTLWRNLDLLYLEDSTFRDQVKNAEEHARLLRLYAPEELQRLHIEREARRGNTAPEPLNLGNDTWEGRLAGVRVGMLHDALREAKNRHIDSPTYAQLFHGSIARLQTLIRAEGLSRTFPNMGDAAKVNAFAAQLSNLDTQLSDNGDELSYRQLLNAVDTILDYNRKTIALPEEILVFEMTDGALARLDPFTAVIWPHDLAQFNRNTEGRFSGVGIQISRPGRLTITQVKEGSPAQTAGLQDQDLITQIDGKDTTTIGVDEANRSLSKDKPVTLVIQRPGQVESTTVTLPAGQDPGLTLARPGRLTVVSPLPGTPAHRAGVKPNDVILSVNDKDTTGWSLDQAVREITGPEGSPVVLSVQRPGKPEPMTFRLTRTSIEIDSIRGWKLLPGGKWDYYIDPARQIGYIRLSQFIPQSSDELEAAFEEMNRQGHVQAVILDLRYNPGGLLRKAADVVDRFVRSGRIVSTVDASGNTTSQYSARPHTTLRSIPMTVLINQGSASASEIVSGALQDYQSALIVGSRSYGKGSVQDLTPIDNGKALIKLTTQYYKLPGGRIIHRKPTSNTWGIEPDLLVPMTEQQAFDAIELRRDLDVLHEADEVVDPNNPLPQVNDMFTRALDPQLEAALMYLRVRLTSDTYMASSTTRREPIDREGPVVPPTTP